MPSKRDDILAASLAVFQEEGLKGARMERIAQAANVSKRTLYKYFEDKEALFDAICAMVIEALSTMEMPDYDSLAPIDVQLSAALKAYIRQTMTAHFLSSSRVIMAEFMRNRKAALVFNEAFVGIDAPLSRLVSEAMVDGRLRPSDPSVATLRLLALYKASLLVPAILNGAGAFEEINPDEIVEESVQMFLARYGQHADERP